MNGPLCWPNLKIMSCCHTKTCLKIFVNVIMKMVLQILLLVWHWLHNIEFVKNTVYNFYSWRNCHTKRKIDEARPANPSFGMTMAKNSKAPCSVTRLKQWVVALVTENIDMEWWNFIRFWVIPWGALSGGLVLQCWFVSLLPLLLLLLLLLHLLQGRSTLHLNWTVIPVLVCCIALSWRISLSWTCTANMDKVYTCINITPLEEIDCSSAKIIRGIPYLSTT